MHITVHLLRLSFSLRSKPIPNDHYPNSLFHSDLGQVRQSVACKITSSEAWWSISINWSILVGPQYTWHPGTIWCFAQISATAGTTKRKPERRTKTTTRSKEIRFENSISMYIFGVVQNVANTYMITWMHGEGDGDSVDNGHGHTIVCILGSSFKEHWTAALYVNGAGIVLLFHDCHFQTSSREPATMDERLGIIWIEFIGCRSAKEQLSDLRRSAFVHH